MQRIILVIAFMTCMSASKAQLKNTMWSGRMVIPDEVEVYLRFTTDTAQLILQDNGYVGETMFNSIKDSVITFKNYPATARVVPLLCSYLYHRKQPLDY